MGKLWFETKFIIFNHHLQNVIKTERITRILELFKLFDFIMKLFHHEQSIFPSLIFFFKIVL